MKQLRVPFNRVNWITSSFLMGTALTALVGVPLYAVYVGFDWFQITLFLVGFILTGLSITLGYHRLFAHQAFQARWPVRLGTLIFGACAFENSALDWASDHRRHHKYVDGEEDPYDISKGFFWAHMGWLLFKLRPEPPRDNVADLQKDPWVMWQHRWVQWIAILVGLMGPALLGYLWDGWLGALGGFLLGGVGRVVMVQHCTFFINSLCHTIGRRPYSSRCTARDSTLMAFLTFGEGYHNFHHAFQHDFRNGIKPWQFDPTKWAILALEKLGLANRLRRVSQGRILLAEMTEARLQGKAHLQTLLGSTAAELPDAWRQASARLQELVDRLTEEIHRLENAVNERVEIPRRRLREWHRETRRLAQQLSELSRLGLPQKTH